MSEKRLIERLDELAQLIEPPMVPVSEDLARGRRGLRRRRRMATAAGVAAVAAAGVIAAIIPVTTSAPRVEVTGQAQSPGRSSAGAGASEEGLRQREGRLVNRQIVATHLDPSGRHLSDGAIRDLSGRAAADPSRRPVRSTSERLVWRADGTSAAGTVLLTLERGRQTLCSRASGTEADLLMVTCQEGEMAGLPVTEIRDPGSTVPRLVYHRRDGVAVSLELDIGPSEALKPAQPPPGSVLDSLPADGSINQQQVADLLSDPALAIPRS